MSVQRAFVVIAMVVGAILLAGCSDGFSSSEAGMSEYFNKMGDHISEFRDDGHAYAYALAVDCHQGSEPDSTLDQAVKRACVSEFGVLSELMTMDDLCDFLHEEANRDVEQINGGKLCG